MPFVLLLNVSDFFIFFQGELAEKSQVLMTKNMNVLVRKILKFLLQLAFCKLVFLDTKGISMYTFTFPLFVVILCVFLPIKERSQQNRPST